MSSVKDFLKSFNLEKYYDKFIDEGYDQLDDLANLDLETLVNDIGLKKGHAKRFLKSISQSNDTEGGPGSSRVPDTDEKENKLADPEELYYSQYPERREWVGIKYAPVKQARDTNAITGNGRPHRVIMIIGETGTGKTTLLNSMTNYLFGVRYADKFRFKLINEDKILEERKDNHQSMTDDVTSYYLEPTNQNVPYDLTVIDTPGFGDTRGLDKDQQIIDKIKKFFVTKMNTITGVCLAVKASNTRLTAAQKYIFSTLLGLFGKDIAENIFVLVTFCDAKKPPCIGALKATKTPYKQLFKLNNSAFFLDEDAENDSDSTEDDDTDFNENCWNIGMRSFEKFFTVIGRTQDKGLGMTKKVLDNRERLLLSIENLHDKIKLGTSKLSELKTTKFALEQLKDRMNSHKEFQIKVTIEEEYKQPLASGTYTTICMKCHYTCHRRCGIPNDDDKRGCWAIGSNGNCQQCTNKCYWTDHANRPYTWERRPKTKIKTDQDIKAKYGKAKNGMSQATHVLTEIEKEIFNVKVDVLDLIKSVSKANDELKQYALRHSPVDQQQYIQLMIKSEKNDLKLGWEKRVESLENLKGMLTTLQSIDSKDYDTALKKITLFSGSSSIKINKQQKTGYLDLLRSKAHGWGINL